MFLKENFKGFILLVFFFIIIYELEFFFEFKGLWLE